MKLKELVDWWKLLKAFGIFLVLIIALIFFITYPFILMLIVAVILAGILVKGIYESLD